MAASSRLAFAGGLRRFAVSDPDPGTIIIAANHHLRPRFSPGSDKWICSQKRLETANQRYANFTNADADPPYLASDSAWLAWSQFTSSSRKVLMYLGRRFW